MAPGIYTARDGRTGRVQQTETGYIIHWNDGTVTVL